MLRFLSCKTETIAILTVQRDEVFFFFKEMMDLKGLCDLYRVLLEMIFIITTLNFHWHMSKIIPLTLNRMYSMYKKIPKP